MGSIVGAIVGAQNYHFKIFNYVQLSNVFKYYAVINLNGSLYDPKLNVILLL